uniref:DUF945 domain-containing protein n=1 Tax=Serratia marcescens TaxID=615 RepID=A0A1C3HNH3_SERMA|nr:Uncharacterised protein [Serratia marcescens]
MRLTSRFGRYNAIRKDRPLTNDELMNVVPSVFSEDKHDSRSDRYTYIPTITLLDKLREEGFQPFYACQTRVRDESKRGHTKHMLRLRRENMIVSGNKEVPEIVLLNKPRREQQLPNDPGDVPLCLCQRNGIWSIVRWMFVSRIKGMWSVR